MEKYSNLLSKKVERVIYELHETIFSYLDFSSLIHSLAVSTEFYNLLNRYFKSFLVKNNLIDPWDKQVSGDHYLRLFRAFYSREVLLTDISSVSKSYSTIRFTRYPRCSTYGVKDFILGTKFVVFHLYNNDLIFLKTEEYTDPSFNVKSITRKNIRHNVSKFFTKSKDFYYLTLSGQLYIIFYDSGLKSDEMREGLLELTLNKPLKDFSISYYHAILLLQVPEPDEKKEEYKEEEGKKRQWQDVQYLNLQNLVPEDLNSADRLRKIEGLDYEKIESFCVGNSVAYFLIKNNIVYECDFSIVNNEKFIVNMYEALKGKAITKLWCGYNFYFALEQGEVESIDKWNQDQILDWLFLKQFNAYRKIIKYEYVSGEQLLKADSKFLADRLGMQKSEIQKRFLNEIEKVSKKSLKKAKLYGWGNNAYGQLGLNTGNATVFKPTEVLLPEFMVDDKIKNIECGMKASAILTEQGSVWISEPLIKNNTQNKEEEETTTNIKKDSYMYKKRSKKESIDVSSKENLKWFNLTDQCTKFRDGMRYKVIKVSLNKDKFAALGANMGYKKISTNHQEVENKTSFSQLKGAEYIYKKILWNSKLDHQEFLIGYEDRFLGTLEIPFSEFSTKADVPPQRIKFIKRKGKLFWDRTIRNCDL